MTLRVHTVAGRALLAAVALMWLAQSSEACSCVPPEACRLPLDSPLIFIGKAVRKQIWHSTPVVRTSPDGRAVPTPPPPPGAPSTVTFSVSEYLKGEGAAEVNINTSEGCCTCGYLFTENVEYVVFAYARHGAWSTNTCTPTRPLKSAAALVEQLRVARSGGVVAQIYGFAGQAGPKPSPEPFGGMEPVSSLRVQAVGSRQTFEAVTSPNGAFAFTDLPADTYRIEPVPPPGSRTAEMALRTPVRRFDVRTDTRSCEANIRLVNDGELSGVLVNAEGRPVRGLVRGLIVDETVPEAQRVVVFHETEADGRFRLPLIASGKYQISVSPMRAGGIDYKRVIYFPGVASSSDARTFEMRPGDRIDSLRMVIAEE